MYCTTWLNLAKNDNVSNLTRCTNLRNFAAKCFNFYNGVAVKPGTGHSNTVDDDILVRFFFHVVAVFI